MMAIDQTESNLLPPARYRPFLSGRYEVSMGLRRLDADFGNGRRDGTHADNQCGHQRKAPPS